MPTERTTPESFELQAPVPPDGGRRLHPRGDGGLLPRSGSEDRVYGIHYAVGIFTNLTQDHLDFHKTMEAYCDAKAILFRNCDRGRVQRRRSLDGAV